MRRPTHGPLEGLVQDFAQRGVGVDLQQHSKANRKAGGRDKDEEGIEGRTGAGGSCKLCSSLLPRTHPIVGVLC